MAPFAEVPIVSLRDSPPVEVFKEPDLLDEWWRSESIYSLERRAIFSQTWVCITHGSRFTKPGDYISLELAGFPVLLILGKDNIIRAFHNVCRHRAYTITKKPAGSSLVLGCRYHGWSYDTKGRLVKAPQFEGINGFDKSENGLFSIHTCTDRAGFVHVNLTSAESLDAPSVEDLMSFAEEYDVSPDSKWILGWEQGGAFNWKTIGASDRTGIGTSNDPVSRATVLEYLRSLFRGPNFESTGYQTFLATPSSVAFTFPKANVWALVTGLPASASETTLKIDVFGTRSAISPPPDLEEKLRDFFSSYVASLEQHYEKVKFIRYEQGEPDQLPLLKNHLRLERLAGREIFPGRRDEGNSESFCRAEKLCNELDMLARTGKAGHGRVDSVQVGLEW